MKKVLSISMCLCILISTLTIIQTTASAQNTYKCGDYSYQYDGNYNDVRIVGYYGNATNLIIPSTLDGKKVTSIDSWAFSGLAFSGRTSLESVTIPDSVTSIDAWAFEDCRSLESITIPNSVTSIGACAFKDCTSLINVSMSNVTYVDDSAFENTACYNNSANWDGSVFYIDKILISGSKYNPDLGKDIYNVPKNYSIRQGTKIICGDAFEDCKSLTSVTIPDSVTDIGAGAFLGCYNLTIKASCKKRRLINYHFNDDDFKIKYQHESSGKWVVVRKRNYFAKNKKVIRCKNCKKAVSTKYYGKKLKFKAKPSVKKITIEKKYAGDGLVWIVVKNHTEYREENKYKVTLECNIKKPKYTKKINYTLYRKYGSKWVEEDSSGKRSNKVTTYEIEKNTTVQYKIKATLYDDDGNTINATKVYKVKVK